MTYDITSVARSIASRRIGQNMTQADLAKKSGIAASTIQSYESEKFGPSLKHATAIAEALGCDVADLLRIPE